MGQSLVQVYIHIVYSTKHRQPFLSDRETRNRVHAYLAGIHKNLGSPALTIGGVEDHLHILCRLDKTLDVSALVRDTKKETSAWIKSEFAIHDFAWQNGYGAFSVSPSHIDPLTKYIRNQEEHHRSESFQDEFRRLCRKYGVEMDERYVWD